MPLYFIDDSDCLEHYGVMGMKWGVRKDRETTSSTTSDDPKNKKRKGLSNKQKRALKIGAAVIITALAAYGGIALYKHMKVSNSGIKNVSGDPLRDSLGTFPNNPVRLKRGTTFQRISSRAVEDYADRGEVYVSTLFRDNAKYKSRMPSEIKRRSGGKPYVHKIKLSTEAKAPSRREAASIYLKLHPKATQAEYQNFLSGMANTPAIKKAASKGDPNAKRLLNSYEAYKNEIRKRGYNAIIDENDASWSSLPLILIEPSDIASTKTHGLNKFERVNAEVFK